MRNENNDKRIAVILPNGLIRYCNPDGTVSKEHGIGFGFYDAERILKLEGYKVIIK
tara:strand:+ start:398 stop:565 length:168 start_codon:yes stop_codon:yes gene_type:complete